MIFAVRPAFDRGNQTILGQMVYALRALVASEDADRITGGAVFLRRS